MTMKNTRIKVVVVGLLVAANIAFLVWVRLRRADVSVAKEKRTWQPLAERTPEDRAQLLDSTFALAEFDVKPLPAEREPVTIPRPKKWREEVIFSTTYANAGPAEVQDGSPAKDSRSDDPKLPWRAGRLNINV